MATSLEILLHRSSCLSRSPTPNLFAPLSPPPSPGVSSRRSAAPGTLAASLEHRSASIASTIAHLGWTHSDVSGIEQLAASSTSGADDDDEDDEADEEDDDENDDGIFEEFSSESYQILDVSADVREDLAIATVWVLAQCVVESEEAGEPPCTMDWVTVLHWRQKAGDCWECFGQSGMRDVTGYRFG